MSTLKSFFQIFKDLFQKYGMKAARSGKQISMATYMLRLTYLTRELNRLMTGKLVMRREDGTIVPQVAYKLKSPYNLRRKHVEALMADWVARDLSAAYIHNMLSMLRVFAGWIGKRDLVLPTAEVVPDITKKRRHLVATRDKSWSGCGINPAEKIVEIEATDVYVAMVLTLMRIFKMRLKEASLLRPWLADRRSYLDINRGTKNDRARTHEIKLARELGAVEKAKAIVGDDSEACLIPREKTYKQWQNRVYYVLRKHGVTIKKVGTSTHGLRHEGLNETYEAATGHPSPVRGGTLGVTDPAKDRLGRREVAEAAGHSRIYKSSAYIGPYQRRNPIRSSNAVSTDDDKQALRGLIHFNTLTARQEPTHDD